MALDALVDSAQLDSDLEDVADAIRAKSGGSGSLAFPAGFVNEIESIQTEGGGDSGGSGETVDWIEYPLVKTYTAAESSTGEFFLNLDNPCKAIRIFIEGVANQDVSAKAYCTVRVGTGPSGYRYNRKCMYGQFVSNAAFVAYADLHLDTVMGKIITDVATGAVNSTNGWLSSRSLVIVNYDVGDKIWNVSIKPDATGGVSVTTGTVIKIYGLEA